MAALHFTKEEMAEIEIIEARRVPPVQMKMPEPQESTFLGYDDECLAIFHVPSWV